MVWTERYKTSEVKKIIGILRKADDDLVGQIAARMVKIEKRGYDLGPATTKRLDDLLAYVREQRAEAMRAAYETTRDDLFAFADYEAEFQAKVITSSAAAVAQIEMVKPSAAQLKAAVTAKPFQGRLLRQWYSDLAADSARKVSDAVKIGIVEGQTTDQIVRRIRGTRARQFQDGVLSITRRNAEAIVRTAVSHTAARAKEDLYAENKDILEGEKVVATLDGKTTVYCISQDSRIYKVGEGPKFPAHFGCRTIRVPFLGNLGIKGQRSSVSGPVPDSLNYNEWLKSQPVAVQNEVLGVKKAQLFRGGLDVDRFVDTTGKEYTLAELKIRDAEIWDKVF